MDEEEDDYISYGTPLPEIEDEATLKKKAIKELQVRDEKGKQRFHGAFTGGFSAGYFNTVGTKEGWTPSTFISSRSKVAEHIQQNPEDFMDDEDFGEFGIATRRIHTTINFQDDSQMCKKRKLIPTDTVIPGEAPLKVIIQPVRESIGIKILKKLGWRHGQGIGPRVKKQSAATKVYGCLPFPSTDIYEEDDPMAVSFTFAPKDIEAAVYKPKDNYFGLAYIGLSKKSILSSHTDLYAQTSTKSWLSKEKKKLAITGHAFGVGAFEDEDEDIYGKDDLAQYDFSELSSEVLQNSPNVNMLKKLKSCTDVIEGYCLASQPPTVKKHYPAPALPSSFNPIHLKLADSETSKINLQRSRHTLSASDRSLILGERFKKTPTNEIATMNTAQKEAVLEKTFSQAKLSNTMPQKFRPFPNDIAKQQRYEEYLRLKIKGDISNLVQPSSMTEWEKQQEIEEFAKAAVLFKPLPNVLSSRFVSKSHLSVEHEVIAELEKIKKEKEMKTVSKKRNLIGSSDRKTFEWHPASLLCKRMNVPNPYPDSSFSSTQSIHKGSFVFNHLSFATERSLPHEQEVTSLTSDTDDKLYDISKDVSNEPSFPEIQPLDSPISPQSEKVVSLSESKRPPIDLFKDIFENSSSDEDSEVDTKFNKNDKHTISSSEVKIIEYEAVEKLPVPSHNAASLNVIGKDQKRNFEDTIKSQSSSVENKKIGFGVFANIDLDAINQRKPQDRVVQTNKFSCKNNKGSTNVIGKISDEIKADSFKTDDMYGPELPPNFSGTVLPTTSNNIVEYKKYDKHKSKHKHKHYKHKSKKKKRKKSLRKDSDSSEFSDETEDVPPTLIIEKLIKLQRRKS